ncbi:MAG TPA: hydantoinase/oxoprolinase family protein [Acidimicrobiia bacterium]|nr:hydantoinase/oxoprolinase family protein [Acidimicrobiia bacterium]
MTESLRVAVDIGGTFTDLVLHEGDRLVATAKTLTTYPDPAAGVAQGIGDLLAEWPHENVTEVVHGTTLVSNALIERRGSVIALITTKGFRDVLTSGKEQRYDMYDLFIQMPEPLVPRRRRYGIDERVLADGTVDRPINLDEVAALIPSLRENEVEAIAVSFLHSYRDPEHERAAAELLRRELPEVPVTISSDVSPEVGEYHRTSTTVANAYVLPTFDRYLHRLEKDLEASGIDAPLHIMLSTGGLATADTARKFPIRLLESGPAAGVLAAAFFGSQDGGRSVFAFDMGGTTAKAGLVEKGAPLIAREHEAARVYRFTKGSGMPIRVPVVDLLEIGAGGGSIARIGTFGLPKVGPDSAASDPGPVCYGLGGDQPTVTDADLVLGYLNPEFFLGGKMKLDSDGAQAAVASLGRSLDLSPIDTAAAIHRVVNENMANAARMHAIERGKDLRPFTLVATGGAGPVHAWGVARALGIARLVFPPHAGVGSAFGMLTAPPSFEFARSLPSKVSGVDWGGLRDAVDIMIQNGRSELEAAGAGATGMSILIAADIRYEGQGDSITVELTPDPDELDGDLVNDRFLGEYLRLFGSRPPDVEAEVLTWRVRVSGPAPRPEVGDVVTSMDNPHKGTRPMWFAEAKGLVTGDVYDRYSLVPGTILKGPCVVEERESTVVVGPGGSIEVDDLGNLEVTIDG